MQVVPDPELVIQAKQLLRRRMKSLRNALPAAAHRSRSQGVVKGVLSLPEVRDAGAIALFAPMLEKRELDLRPLDMALRAAGTRLYYPFMDPRGDGSYTTGFREVMDSAELIDRGRGFAEPDPRRPAARRGDIDVVVVPALAVDPRGCRLGYGGGIYDSTLPDVSPPARTVAVAFDFQLLVELPVNDADVACDIVVTDLRVLRRTPTNAAVTGSAQ